MTRNKPHILFLFSDTGGGHRSATEAIIEAIELEFGDRITTEMVDFFKEYTLPPFNRFPNLYPRMVRFPTGWKMGYHLSNGPRRVKMIHSSSWLYVRQMMKRLFEEHPSDLIVSIHPLANEPALRALGNARPPFTVVVTDLVTTHAFWYSKRADLTIVPTRPAFERGLKYGLPPERMEIVGLPVADRFCRPNGSRAGIREQLGWPQEMPVVVLVGGGDGMGPLEQTAHALAKANLPAALAIVAGRNESLKSRLEKHDWPMPTFIYGFVRNMPDMMQAADILVTKAGPGTICEALNAGLPIILYSRLPGQEDGNVSFAVDNGAGIWAPKPDQIVQAVRRWLTNADAYQQAVAACKKLARPDASREIARILAGQLNVDVRKEKV